MGARQMTMLNRADLAERGIKFSAVQLWRLWTGGKFPRPVKLSSKNVWPASEIDAWLQARIAERDRTHERSSQLGCERDRRAQRGVVPIA
jgi:predicted DNA-binding transcriptional regulator AlpA